MSRETPYYYKQPRLVNTSGYFRLQSKPSRLKRVIGKLSMFI